ncbi:MAG: hypothetical protein GX046_07540 [Tissierellia bacterium]|nr:hypothetical protein [Tissierellia bacterium]
MKKVTFVKMEALSGLILDTIQNEGKLKLTVTGNSMYPLLRHGIDSVVLKSVQHIKKYDILLYKRQNGAYILHRVIKIKDSILYIAGDNESNIEYPVYLDQVLAVVEGFYRKEQYISCKNLFYKLYCVFWVMVIPYRHQMIRLLKKIRFCWRRLRRKKNGN